MHGINAINGEFLRNITSNCILMWSKGLEDLWLYPEGNAKTEIFSEAKNVPKIMTHKLKSRTFEVWDSKSLFFGTISVWLQDKRPEFYNFLLGKLILKIDLNYPQIFKFQRPLIQKWRIFRKNHEIVQNSSNSHYIGKNEKPNTSNTNYSKLIEKITSIWVNRTYFSLSDDIKVNKYEKKQHN